jgi:DNA polymerase-3 subunit alpha
MNIVEQVKAEKQFLEYVTYTNPKVNEQYYIVTSFTHYKNPLTPYLVLHRIKDGEDIKTRIKQGKIFKEQPFGEYSIIKVKDFSMQYKKKCIAGVWQETDELEPILTSYEVIK